LEITIIRMRLLAEGPCRLWMAVGGTLGARTRRQLRRWLHDQVDDGYREFFLDLRELSCFDGLSADELRTLFPEHAAARFHLIGAPDPIRACATGDPRFTLHTAAESAWRHWLQSS
jgi:hypothetical protein